ncbi:Serine/threonine-protein kinase NLK [Atta colombica]|uniref:Serine/threonine-protein kinase NLK n=1 Tax=Atta colombica TaxID=520822 RepID=A0A195AVK0_9HYME|nr:Serine/threonine-protein kinase NLK [Atta colombica]
MWRAAIRFRKGAERSMQANHLDIPGVPSGFAPRISSSSISLSSSLSFFLFFSLPLRPVVFLGELLLLRNGDERVPVAAVFLSGILGHVSPWAVTDPRDGRRVALKKLPNVFQSLVSSKRVFRELKMLCFFKHDNVLSALDILQPPHLDFFQEMYPFLNACTQGHTEDKS